MPIDDDLLAEECEDISDYQASHDEEDSDSDTDEIEDKEPRSVAKSLSAKVSTTTIVYYLPQPQLNSH